MLPKLSLPAQLILVLISVLAFGMFLPSEAVQFFYSLSLTFKECLGFLLPFMIFSFITTGILSFQHRAPLVLGLLLLFVCASNIIVPLISYAISISLLSVVASNTLTEQLSTSSEMNSLWLIKLPRILQAEHAIILALITGIILSKIKLPKVVTAITNLKKSIEWIINNLFITILPLYVFGFLLEVYHRGVFIQLCQSYGKTFGLIIMLQFILMFMLYWIAGNFENKTTFSYIRTSMPSYLTAFGTMSSSAAIPITTQCAIKNTNNQPLAQVATPILANIHMYGDLITVPTLATITLFIFTGTAPELYTFTTFIMYYCLTMLAASGVPGGGMIIAIPILKSILGFTDPMISILITLHLLQDSFGTGANVMGDGALMIIINKILRRITLTSASR